MNTHSRTVRVVGMISVAVVAIVAAVVSYAHMQTVAAKAGEGWRSYLEPLSVDGLLVGASLVLYVRRTSRFAWLAVTVGILVSLAANLAAAHPSLTSRLVSAWPAVALALSYETLLTLVRQPHHETSNTQSSVDESLEDSLLQTDGPASGLNGHVLDADQPDMTDRWVFADDTTPTNGASFDPYAWMRENTQPGRNA